ncbi:hypothetical protein H238_2864 [Klebsiella pneumoniae UHKPC179]|nr:hypothetical protein CSC13_1761 [Klebsiella pneumoniae]EJK91741.1 hypothetical protein UUU_10800 [Klebsiella pneumoniae subsp. pneumoniae DSM 30104 = JCM 1662 = NBRC 14940]EPA89765.1 hypothetical protein H237_2821 [Klebsiella pneumoniae UHKPC57]EPO91028.1 hypothetical protein H238_2864 [Klebsiella pneumoniae UHKPC179]CDL15113.1 hypothetical protein [Klebsiella pneumoniae IS46]
MKTTRWRFRTPITILKNQEKTMKNDVTSTLFYYHFDLKTT